MDSEVHAVTGAFGYSGRYIARRLLDAGKNVITLTNSTAAGPLANQISSFPLCFDNPKDLERSLTGVDVLYNTYWVRFNHRHFSHHQAVHNTQVLFEAASRAGVRRVVHVSITNPSIDSPLEYFRGKAELESVLMDSDMSHAILRPTVLFGREDILINNIAWILRRFPVFGVFGDGGYRLQPVFVDDLAELAVLHGQRFGNVTVDAIGPETFTYREMVKRIGEIIGCKRHLVSIPPAVGFRAGRVLGNLVGDVVITREEIRGLMDGLLCVESQPSGHTRLTEWATNHKTELGKKYASELARRRPEGSKG